MKKEYDTSVKEAIERVMGVFSEYIKTTPYSLCADHQEILGG